MLLSREVDGPFPCGITVCAIWLIRCSVSSLQSVCALGYLGRGKITTYTDSTRLYFLGKRSSFYQA